MGNKVEPRREWIEQNVQFTMTDDKESDELVENKGRVKSSPQIKTWNQH